MELTKIHINYLGQFAAIAAMKDEDYIGRSTEIIRRNCPGARLVPMLHFYAKDSDEFNKYASGGKPAPGGSAKPSTPAKPKYTEAQVRQRATARGLDGDAAVAAAKQRGLL